jgi:hypothetical protein
VDIDTLFRKLFGDSLQSFTPRAVGLIAAISIVFGVLAWLLSFAR